MEAARATLALLPILATLRGGLTKEVAKKHVTIDAAYGFRSGGHHYVHLLVGHSVQVIKDGVGQYVMDRARLGIPEDMKMRAAFTKSARKNQTVFYGDNYGVLTLAGQLKHHMYYCDIRKFGMDEPDAAGRVGGDVFTFKGCKVLKRSLWVNGSPRRNKMLTAQDMGLPCHPDAAFDDGQGLVVIKGNQVWRYANDGQPATEITEAELGMTDNWVLQGPEETVPGAGEAGHEDEEGGVGEGSGESSGDAEGTAAQ